MPQERLRQRIRKVEESLIKEAEFIEKIRKSEDRCRQSENEKKPGFYEEKSAFLPPQVTEYIPPVS